MPFFWTLVGATNGTSESDRLRFLTVANQRSARIKEVVYAAAHTAAGGSRLRVARFTTPSTGGSTVVGFDRDRDGPAPQTTLFSPATPGSGRLNQLSVGAGGIGGTGVWRALDNAHAITLTPNGGADGNCDFIDISSSAPIVRTSMTWEE